MQKHFVRFYSPGTFVAETTEKEIASWDVDKAVEMARRIVERCSVRPYGFRFVTRGRGTEDFYPQVLDESPMYYLGGTVETLEEVKARATPDDSILISNMEGNGWDRIITTPAPWKWVQALYPADVVLDITL